MFDLNELQIPAYLVGGWVRDRLFNRTSKYLDLDFVLPEQVVETARRIAKNHGAGFVLLDAERQIARVVFKDGTADFAQQMGNSIIDDLGCRDFTMNAIAIDCAELSTSIISQIKYLPKLIDPFSGQADIESRQIRMLRESNLRADPLRILRAYRQAAQLGCEIEPITRRCLIQIAPSLENTAAERVRTELSYLLALGESGSRWLSLAIDDGILGAWIPTKNLMMERFKLIDGAIAEVIEQWQELDDYFNQILSSDHSVTVIIKLAAISNSATALTSLGFSRLEQRWIVTLMRYLPIFLNYLDLDQSMVSASQQYQLFMAIKEMFPALSILAIASGKSLISVIPWLNRWLAPNDPIAHQIPLINGDDLKNELGLKSGAKIGDVLNQLKLAQVEQVITNHENAIAYAKTLI
ncbi:tRNA nucleotidyltransferase/poly(A) polymerase [Synechococcus sp. PCC 7502]|uniref:CCA tRNA nucleotidyltransferase n=1 Tax=Synechococcus sp. PCC 7502 TaxID=1173263 RepID=UPI00029FF0D1|nr:CCA tRNA nucleotidyltransferase [Synechococcus sp. PCC 7502]AFY75288.1 tRNA nucleotidyltransferase/poly(A) polymerase [Synechococcus sp. PCC 7502]